MKFGASLSMSAIFMWTKLSSLFILAGEPETRGDGGGVHGYSTVLARFIVGFTTENKTVTCNL
jgi:hypothetical protein